MRQKQVARKHGFRSGLEEDVARQLDERNKGYDYEVEKIEYIQPEKKRTYTPDYRLKKKVGGYMYIETKGRWVLEDRKKMVLVTEQHPDMDVRFVFQNPNAKISKRSSTTYADFCEKHGWLYAKKEIPSEWLDECEDFLYD